jgi:hypothetical protein
LTVQLQLPLDANNEKNWFNLKIIKFNAKFDNSLAEKLLHFYGQFATFGDWRQGYPTWW